MKYIVMHVELQKGGQLEIPIMFPELLVHKDIADAIKDVLIAQFKGSVVKPIAGGFVNSADCAVECCRESTSLKLKSREEEDSQLIQMSDYGGCIV